MAPSSAAMILREAWGDRKPPDITRKITACVACRKLKAKCHMTNSQPPCSRCKPRGLPCTVNKSIQMLLESDATWKEELEDRVAKLESLLASTGSGAETAVPDPTRFTLMQQSVPLSINPSSRLISSQTPQSQPTIEIALNFTCSLGAFPATSMTDTKMSLPQIPTPINQDPVSQGILTSELAEGLFDRYQTDLDRSIYKILPPGDTLRSVRARSPLLTAAICTVAAMCQGSPVFESCRQAFTAAVSAKLFSKEHRFDDIRALCIGAFWLSDISYTLCSLAVRLASEVNLHRCISKMPHTDIKCYERTRLYFLVFICDHHCSLQNGRPPMTRTLRSLKAPFTLLQSQHSTSLDVRLIAEVELWTLSAQVFESFGADVGTAFDDSHVVQLERFSKQFDNWHDEWTQVLSLRNELDHSTAGILQLHFQAAKLCLHSHVFRGTNPASQQAADVTPVSQAIKKMATLAKEHASSFLSAMTGTTKLEDLSVYFTTMVGFASVFLLRTACRERPSRLLGEHDEHDILTTLRALSRAIHSGLDGRIISHPLQAIANGIDVTISGRSDPATGYATGRFVTIAPAHIEPSAPLPDPIWDDNLFGNDFLEQPLVGHSSWMTFPFAHEMRLSCPDADLV